MIQGWVGNNEKVQADLLKDELGEDLLDCGGMSRLHMTPYLQNHITLALKWI